MLQAFGFYAGAVGLVMTVEFFHVGFLVKRIHKEQKATNEVLRQLVQAKAK